MAELYRVLQLNNVQWKKIGPYNIKCRRAVKCGRLARQATARMVDDIDEDVAERLEISDGHSAAAQGHAGAMLGHQHHATTASSSSLVGAMGGSGMAIGSMVAGPGSSFHNMPSTAGGALSAAAAAASQAQQQHSGGGASRNADVPPGFAVVKFEVQMYKSRDDEYVLDIQRIDGELFLFMDTCGLILADLRI